MSKQKTVSPGFYKFSENSRRYVKIIGPSRVTIEEHHTEGPQI